MITHGARRPSARSRGPTCTSTNRRRVGTSRPHGGSSCKRRGTMTAGGHGGATRPTEMGRDHRGDDQPETPRTSGMISVGLGPSGLRPELRICGRRFDSSRGHSDGSSHTGLAQLPRSGFARAASLAEVFPHRFPPRISPSGPVGFGHLDARSSDRQASSVELELGIAVHLRDVETLDDLAQGPRPGRR